MNSPVTHTHTFLPAQNGSGWPYMILTLIGAALCFYLAIDLYQTLVAYGKAPQRDFVFALIIAGFGMLFLLATLGFWFYPWSWASMSVDAKGITLSVTGWGGIPETHIPWDSLETITVVIMPKGASTLSLTPRDGTAKTVRISAFAKDPDAYLPTFQQCAQSTGYAVTGSDLKSPMLGKRSWTVQKKP